MVNFFYQVGYSGLAIFLLSLMAIYMAIRGVVLVLLIKRHAFREGGIQKSILDEVIKTEKAALKDPENCPAPSRELVISTLMQVRMKGVYSSMHFLKLCAAVGPLLGLLGTVLGLVDVFSTLSTHTAPDPNLLAGGIWEALLTTVMGLDLAIPAILVHYYILMSLRSLRNRINLAASNIDV